MFKQLNGKAKWIAGYNRRIAGTPAGHRDAAGYIKMRVDGQMCFAHRLVWKVIVGRDPVGLIDHINGIRDDNRLENLRDVTPEVNVINTMRGRWKAERLRRAHLQAFQRRTERERKERALLAKLKEKYEP